MSSVTELKFVTVQPDNTDLRDLIERLDEDLKARYPHEMIYVVDFTDPKVKEMTFVVAYLGGQPVGCGGLRPLEKDSSVMELKRFYVEPGSRKMGIAGKMLADLEEKAAVAGCVEIKLETGIKQPEAIALYVKHGYRPIDLFGQYIGDPDSVCYGKILS
ncbi:MULTISPECIES: GNAT family N-acetyltransferase [unclassified Paenibacillus]|uniref:GNAT family N-acetyltransferase n=1 Tax=unclassified Paenibacillus TaxID=185978 RepID=UPI002405328E|nr:MULTISPECIES: GNAT family N-acetyltransferase [unclassified Paenibacillus]MDF9842956.1 putative acetyltransferase [Paenibacillus sp. PastF-2]MDF9849544.1 putative acetyltransferase [Paenibacillus sp. PastM-2]MDF9856081.1 putative acetyltransferase [Paenibacillus sp. PastF-1]MDH6481387.1 putative acetyltransferase [Paenibacillus sp. PastH-2]MDH6508770.1 putative acetyltransferase [Paenibacillus sp. PastM-3]